MREQLTEANIDKVYAQYAPRLRNFFLGLLHAEEYDREAAAEDLVHETFLKAWLHRSDYRGDAELQKWLYAIARNQFLDHYRKSNNPMRRGTHIEATAFFETSEGVAYEQSVLAADPTQEAAVLEREFVLRISSLIKELPGKNRAVLMLYVIEGIPFDEIAERLDMSNKAIKAHVFRGRFYLKTRVKRMQVRFR